VLSPPEVTRFLASVASLRDRVALTTAYAAGLRACGVVAIRIQDIDSSRMLIRIERGRGAKQRYVMLSPTLLGILRPYWAIMRPSHWLFPGRDPAKPLDQWRLNSACQAAVAAAGLRKRATVH